MRPYRAPTARRRVRLGELLVEAGVVTRPPPHHAPPQPPATGDRLGKVLVGMGLATQDAIAKAVANQLGIEYINIQALTIADDVLTSLPETVIRRHQVIPIRVEDNVMVLGMVDPLDVVALDDIRRLTDREVLPAAITLDGYQSAVNKYPALESSLDQVIQEIRPSDVGEEEPALDKLREIVEDAPVVRLGNLMLVQAGRQGGRRSPRG